MTMKRMSVLRAAGTAHEAAHQKAPSKSFAHELGPRRFPDLVIAGRLGENPGVDSKVLLVERSNRSKDSGEI